jgi:hypothetical protein
MVGADAGLRGRVRGYLHVNGWLCLRLTGERAFDPANASFTGLFGTLADQRWSPRWCEYFGVDPDWLPGVVDGRRTVGSLRAEATAEPDDYYRQGRYAVTPKEERAGCLLRSLTPRQELADFLAQRGYLRLDRERYREAAKAFAWASELYPENKFHACSMVDTLDEWKAKQVRRLPAVAPRILIGYPPPTFRHVPLSIERELIGRNVVEDLLDSPRAKEVWRCGDGTSPPTAVPRQVSVEYPARQLWMI